MTDASSMNPIPVGLDDGYAYTKVALPDGRLIVIPSRGRTGQAGVTWIDQGQQRIFEYETADAVYSVGTVHRAHRVHCVGRLVLEDALLTLIDPRHTGLPRSAA